MKKVIQKVFGNKEERSLHDEDITHIGGVTTEPIPSSDTSELPAQPSLVPEPSLTDTGTTQIIGQPSVKETIHPVETEVVQPVIHRETVQTDLKQVTQPITEKQVLPPTEETKVLPAEHRETVAEPALTKPDIPTQTVVSEPEKRVIQNEPLIHETVKHQVIEQVQPVIQREVEQHHIIHTEQPIYERVLEAPRIISEERAPIEKS